MIVFAVVWFVVKVVLPLMILNSAAILAVCALARPRLRKLLAGLSLAGGGYLALDVSNDWLAAGFVDSVTGNASWITSIVYLNALAMGSSALLLIRTAWVAARPLATSLDREAAKNARLRLASCVLAVVAACASLPMIFHLVPNPFGERQAKPANVPGRPHGLDVRAQEDTVFSILSAGPALFAYQTDNLVGGDADPREGNELRWGSNGDSTSAPIEWRELRDKLVPQYIADLPRHDGWGHELEYRVDPDAADEASVASIRSPGRDGSWGSPYQVGTFDSSDFDQDIVWSNGSFKRWPDVK